MICVLVTRVPTQHCPHPGARQGHPPPAGSSLGTEGISHSLSMVTCPRCSYPNKVRHKGQQATQGGCHFARCPCDDTKPLSAQALSCPFVYSSEEVTRGRKESRLSLSVSVVPRDRSTESSFSMYAQCPKFHNSPLWFCSKAYTLLIAKAPAVGPLKHPAGIRPC